MLCLCITDAMYRLGGKQVLNDCRTAPTRRPHLLPVCNSTRQTVKFSPSPSELKEYLESLKQRATLLKERYKTLIAEPAATNAPGECNAAAAFAEQVNSQLANQQHDYNAQVDTPDNYGSSSYSSSEADASAFFRRDSNAQSSTVQRVKATAVADTPSVARSEPPSSAPTSQSSRVATEVLAKLLAVHKHNGPVYSNTGGDNQKRPESQTIVFVTAEVTPWSKSGGLGDVIGSLPIALAARGHRVMVVSPRYLLGQHPPSDLYAGVTQISGPITLDLLQGGRHTVTYHHCHRDHVDWVFVDHMCYHRPGNPYGNSYGPYQDNLFRFALLSLAALEAPLQLNIGGFRWQGEAGAAYGQDLTFVASDWHTALLPVYIGSRFRPHNVYPDARTVLAIHNLAHQGSAPPEEFRHLGVPADWFGCLEWVDPLGAKTINILKGAITTADHILTVSQHYAWQVTRRSPEPLVMQSGGHLAPLLASRAAAGALTGVVNGLDVREWDPASDPHLAAHYDVNDLANKSVCKAALQTQLRLPPDPAAPLLVFIGRLDYQKGPHLVLGLLPVLVGMGCQVVLLGQGAHDYEQQAQAAQRDHPYSVRACVEFSVPLSHQLIAAADVLLMPSLFEPCGLTQLAAMRYGTLPVAHATGGLRDTIDPFRPFADEGDSCVGTGFTFSPASPAAFKDAVLAALKVFRDRPVLWRSMQRAAMSEDRSWTRAAGYYESILESVRQQPAYCK